MGCVLGVGVGFCIVAILRGIIRNNFLQNEISEKIFDFHHLMVKKIIHHVGWVLGVSWVFQGAYSSRRFSGDYSK